MKTTFLLVNDKTGYVIGHYDTLKYARVRRSQLGRKGLSIVKVLLVEEVPLED